MRRAAALIVGGGPAGAAAAITLARGGQRPLLLERSTGPHDVVCGGFLSGDTLARLRALGLDPAALGARPIERLRLIRGGRVIEHGLPFPAAGLSRRTLDEALLARAAAAGAAIERGAHVRRIEDGAAVIGEEAITADALFVATGKHELRGMARGRRGGAIGLRRSVSAARLDGAIELHLFDGGYAGLLAQEDGRANLCLSVTRERFAAARGRPDALIEGLAREAPALGARCSGDEPWSAIAAIPYGWRALTGEDGRYRVGDQAAVIASIVGDGIAIALASGTAAAEAWLRGEEAPSFQRRFAARAAGPLRIAGSVKAVAESPTLRPLAWPALRLPGLVGAIGHATRIG